ncbi:MAG: DUF4375 domain-containing protein [Candidatus Brocadiia bacterium]
MEAGELFWQRIDPYWNLVVFHDTEESYLTTIRKMPPAAVLLTTAYLCYTEVCNGGYTQYFVNSSGLGALEAIQGFRDIGMERWAELTAKAVKYFGEPYPRMCEDRWKKMGIKDNRDPAQINWKLFEDLDNQFFAAMEGDHDMFDRLVDKYTVESGI